MGALTRASNTSVSKVSLSEFSIMMLNRASKVSWRNCGDTGRGRREPGPALTPAAAPGRL